ncbi:hypothetical protein BH10BDE1_BH10BDE1_02820 [soil metagenome]
MLMEFNFIFEELSDLDIESKPMFGARGVYYDGKIVFILRDRPSSPQDNGLWIATTGEHHESLRNEFPEMRSIELFGPGPTGWQNIPLESETFEESALRICELIRARDPRVGKIPKKSIRRKKKSAKKVSVTLATRAARNIGKKKPKNSAKPLVKAPGKSTSPTRKKSAKRPKRR